MKKTLITASISLLTLGGCMSTYQQTSAPNGAENAQTGAILGAALGGILGASSDEKKLQRGVVGAAIGGALGGVIGQQLDKQAEELRSEMGSDVQIVNTGSELVVTMPQDILFASDSAALVPSLRGDLVALAQNLLNYPNTTVEVVGHTDSTGTASHNQTLSSQRATSVSTVLQQNGVPAERIVAYGLGEDSPVATNLSEAGKAQNRRVEIVITPTV